MAREIDGRRWLAAAGCFVLLTTAAQAPAQTGAWRPERNVEIIASSAVGSGLDATARFLQKLFEERQLVGTRCNVVNKSAGGGAETWTYLSRHPANGHYLAIFAPTLLTNHIMGAAALTYTDITPITILSNEYTLAAVHPSSPLRTGKDLAARLGQDVGSVSIGFASALGSNNHIVAALIARAAGGDAKKLRVVVYETGTKAAAAVMDGKVDVVFATAGTLLKQVPSGELRLLGVTAQRRLGGPLADVPTWKEQGFNVVSSAWRGVAGPRDLTKAQVAYWEDVFLKLSWDDAWLDDLRKQSWDGAYLNSSETRKFLEDQYALMRGVLRDLGLAK